MSYRLKDRLKEHFDECYGDESRTHKSLWLKTLFKKNLLPKLIILDVVLHENRGEAEKKWIKILKESGADLTNSSEGGIGNLGWKHTEETRKRIGLAGLGHPTSLETRLKIGNANSGREPYSKGRPMDENQKEKIKLTWDMKRKSGLIPIEKLKQQARNTWDARREKYGPKGHGKVIVWDIVCPS